MSEMKNIRWTSVGEKDGKLYYFKDGKWVAAVDEKGGGSDVEANPSEEATTSLDKLKVGDTVYGIEGGGSSEEIEELKSDLKVGRNLDDVLLLEFDLFRMWSEEDQDFLWEFDVSPVESFYSLIEKVNNAPVVESQKSCYGKAWVHYCDTKPYTDFYRDVEVWYWLYKSLEDEHTYTLVCDKQYNEGSYNQYFGSGNELLIVEFNIESDDSITYNSIEVNDLIIDATNTDKTLHVLDLEYSSNDYIDFKNNYNGKYVNLVEYDNAGYPSHIVRCTWCYDTDQEGNECILFNTLDEYAYAKWDQDGSIYWVVRPKFSNDNVVLALNENNGTYEFESLVWNGTALDSEEEFNSTVAWLQNQPIMNIEVIVVHTIDEYDSTINQFSAVMFMGNFFTGNDNFFRIYMDLESEEPELVVDTSRWTEPNIGNNPSTGKITCHIGTDGQNKGAFYLHITEDTWNMMINNFNNRTEYSATFTITPQSEEWSSSLFTNHHILAQGEGTIFIMRYPEEENYKYDLGCITPWGRVDSTMYVTVSESAEPDGNVYAYGYVQRGAHLNHITLPDDQIYDWQEAFAEASHGQQGDTYITVVQGIQGQDLVDACNDLSDLLTTVNCQLVNLDTGDSVNYNRSTISNIDTNAWYMGTIAIYISPRE